MAAGDATIHPSRERVVQAGNSSTLQFDLGAVAESQELIIERLRLFVLHDFNDNNTTFVPSLCSIGLL
jgi:hypothetical protein